MKRYLQYINEKLELEKPFFMYDRNELIMKNPEVKGITSDNIFLKNISFDDFFKAISNKMDKLYLGYSTNYGPKDTKSILLIYDMLNRKLDKDTIESLWISDEDPWSKLTKLNCITILFFTNKKSKVIFHMWDESDNKLHYYEILKYVDSTMIENELFPLIVDKIVKEPELLTYSYIKHMLHDLPEINNQIAIKDPNLAATHKWGLI